MAQYEPFEAGVEARGRVIIAIEEGIEQFRDAHREAVRAALAERGIADPDPDDWYAQAAELDVLATIAEEFGPHVLDRLGGGFRPSPGGRAASRASRRDCDPSTTPTTATTAAATSATTASNGSTRVAAGWSVGTPTPVRSTGG
jgi:hypothetical protein